MSQESRKKLKMSMKQKEMIAESLADFFYGYFQKRMQGGATYKKDEQGSVRVPRKIRV